LLEKLHEKKISSFHIIVRNTKELSEDNSIPWQNYIDTLYLGPILDKHLDGTRPQKRLSLDTPECFTTDLIDLMEGSTTLKSLYVNDFCYSQMKCPSTDLMKPLLVFVSGIKALKNLTLFFRVIDEDYGEMTCNLLRQIVEKESLENLESFTCEIQNSCLKPAPLALPLLYSSKMKSLKSLSIILNCLPLKNDISYLLENLKELVNLESFQFDCIGIKNDGKITCNFPSEGLKNLKSLSLNCDLKFSEVSVDNWLIVF